MSSRTNPIPVWLYCFCSKDQVGQYLGDCFADPVLIRGCMWWPSEAEVPPRLCFSMTLFFCPDWLTLWDSMEYIGNCTNGRVCFLLKRPLHFACDKNRFKFCFSSSHQAHNIWRGSPSFTTSYTLSRSREVRKTFLLKQDCAGWTEESCFLCFDISVSLPRNFNGSKHLCSHLLNSSNIYLYNLSLNQ